MHAYSGAHTQRKEEPITRCWRKFLLMNCLSLCAIAVDHREVGGFLDGGGGRRCDNESRMTLVVDAARGSFSVIVAAVRGRSGDGYTMEQMQLRHFCP